MINVSLLIFGLPLLPEIVGKNPNNEYNNELHFILF